MSINKIIWYDKSRIHSKLIAFNSFVNLIMIDNTLVKLDNVRAV